MNGQGYTVHVCAAGSHRIDAQVKRGTTVDDTASGSVRVAANIPRRGAAATLAPGTQNGSIEVSWKPPHDGGSTITGYRVRYTPQYRSNPQWKNSGWLSADTRTHTVSGLTYGRGYYFSVQARNAAGEGQWSTSAIAVAPGPAPSQVRKLAATPGNESIELSWQPPPDAQAGDIVTGYLIRHKRSGDASYVNSGAYISGTRHTVSGLRNGIEYDFQVRAVTAVAHGAPRTIRATPDKSPAISIRWLEASLHKGESDRFTVSVSGLSPTRDYKIALDAGSGLAFDAACTDRDLERAVPRGESAHEFHPTAYACSVGTHAAEARIKRGSATDDTVASSVSVTLLPPPDGLRANGNSIGYVKGEGGWAIVRWDAVPGASGYEVRYAEECIDDEEICDPNSKSWTQPFIAINPVVPETVANGLDLETLYRIQLRTLSVRGARSEWSEPVFAYPTARPPKGPVATMPYFGYLPGGEYSFAVCKNTIPDVNKSQWIADIRSGIDSWEETVRWKTGSGNNIAQSSYEPNHLCKREVSSTQSEVRFVDMNMLIMKCGALHNIVSKWTERRSIACMRSDTMTSLFRTTIDVATIYLWRDANWNPGQDLTTAPCSKLHIYAMHEAGHAFGFGGLPNKHANGGKTVMLSTVPLTFCEPQLYDIVAMMALYQSR